MSRCFEIACVGCRVALWIGQGGHIYTDDPDTMRWLTAFLFSHVDHTLVFDEDQKLSPYTYRRIEEDAKDRCVRCDLTAGHDEGPPEFAEECYSLPVRPRP
jgi:hypothetical protein